MCKFILLALLVISPNIIRAQAENIFRSNRTDTFYNVAVADPYRSLEDTGNATVKAWMKAESDKSQAMLRTLPGYNKLYKQFKEAIENSKLEEINQVGRLNNKWFAIKRYPTQDNPMLYGYDANGRETLLMNPVKEFPNIKSKNVSLVGISSSATDRFVSYVVVAGGNEMDPLESIHDTKTGKKDIEPSFTGGKKMSAAFDDRYDSVMYYYYAPFRHEGDPVKWWDSMLVYKHSIGAENVKDEMIIDFASQKIKRTLQEGADLVMPYKSDWAIAAVKNLVSKELRLYTTPKKDLSLNSVWTKICDYEDGIVSYAVYGNDIYMMTYKDAPHFKVISTSLSQPSLKNAATVIPQQNFVMEDMHATKDMLLVNALTDEGGKLISYMFGSKKSADIRLPLSGTVRINYASPKERDFIYSINSWTRTAQTYRYNSIKGASEISATQKNLSIGSEGLEVKEVKVKSHDGVMVPMTIIYKKGLKPSAYNYTGLTAYGAYGHQDNPYFWPEDMVRFDRGYVRAIAHVRGGGIYGEEWHIAGRMANKPNTWKDVIACAEFLIANKYAMPGKLALSGGSAGGITAGRSITERPDLFRAAIIGVGALDMVGFERSPNGAGNTTEFGSTKTKEGFESLLTMSTYHHIKDGTSYPAIMFTHGVNDNRVPVYNSVKTYARFKEATSSGLPVLLNLNFDSGHGMQQTNADIIQSAADNLSFIYWMMGYPDFEPVKK